MQNRSVLVIDDDPSSLALARSTLEFLGLTRIQTATNGAEGIRRFDRMQPRPDLVILDLFMPEMDAIETMAKLGERRYLGGVILATGGDTSIMDTASELAQIRDHLNVLGAYPKPLQAEQIQQALLSLYAHGPNQS